MDENKNIDETWKQKVKEEKQKQSGDEKQFIPPDFFQLVLGLVIQAKSVMGPENRDLKAALYLIELLNVLKEKTKGNLTHDESEFLSNALQDVQMEFVKISDTPNKPKIEIP